MGVTKVRLQRKQNQKAYQIEKQGKDMRLILETMYKEATIYLERKHSLYLATLNKKRVGITRSLMREAMAKHKDKSRKPIKTINQK